MSAVRDVNYKGDDDASSLFACALSRTIVARTLLRLKLTRVRAEQIHSSIVRAQRTTHTQTYTAAHTYAARLRVFELVVVWVGSVGCASCDWLAAVALLLCCGVVVVVVVVVPARHRLSGGKVQLSSAHIHTHHKRRRHRTRKFATVEEFVCVCVYVWA